MSATTKRNEMMHYLLKAKLTLAKQCFLRWGQQFEAKQRKKGEGGNILVVFCLVAKKNIVSAPNYPKERKNHLRFIKIKIKNGNKNVCISRESEASSNNGRDHHQFGWRV